MLGLGNSGGGCLVAGVAEKEDRVFEAEGLEKLTDKVDIVRGIERYVPTTFLRSKEVLNFSYGTSEYLAIQHRKFRAIFIEDARKHVWYIAEADGDGIRTGAVYIRRGTSTEVANRRELLNTLSTEVSRPDIDRRENVIYKRP